MDSKMSMVSDETLLPARADGMVAEELQAAAQLHPSNTAVATLLPDLPIFNEGHNSQVAGAEGAQPKEYCGARPKEYCGARPKEYCGARPKVSDVQVPNAPATVLPFHPAVQPTTRSGSPSCSIQCSDEGSDSFMSCDNFIQALRQGHIPGSSVGSGRLSSRTPSRHSSQVPNQGTGSGEFEVYVVYGVQFGNG